MTITVVLFDVDALFDLLFLDNDLQEQWSDQVSVDTNLTCYDVQSHHELQEQLMMLQ